MILIEDIMNTKGIRTGKICFKKHIFKNVIRREMTHRIDIELISIR